VKFKSPVAKTEMLPDQTRNDVRREEREKPLARAAGGCGVVSPAASALLTAGQGVAVAASTLTDRWLQDLQGTIEMRVKPYTAKEV
jgi:hypothetical protein